MSGTFRWRRVCASLALAALSVSPLVHAGTPHLVLDVNSVTESLSSEPYALGKLGGVELFRATLSTPEVARAGLVKSDGTPAGTVTLKTFEGKGPVRQTVMTIGTRAFFVAEETATGSQVWVTDGTASGTRQVTTFPLPPVTNPPTSSDPPRLLAAFGNDLLFVRRFGTGTDYQLFRTDGTTAGTVQLGQIRLPNDSLPKFDFAVVGNRIYFVSFFDTITELWASDGTEAGTKRVPVDGALGTNPNIRMLRAVNGGVVFLTTSSYFGQEITRVDAATDAISVVDLAFGNSSGVMPTPTLPVVNGYVYFAGTQSQTGDYELWRSDGTPSGTTLVKDINAGVAGSFQPYLTGMTKIGDRVVFNADDGAGSRLWASDGTASGTTKLIDLYLDLQFVLEENSAPLIRTEKYLYVTARTGRTVRTDGTPGGTFVLPTTFSTGERVSFGRAAGDATSEYIGMVAQDPVTAAATYHVFKLTPPNTLTPMRSSSDPFGVSSFEYVNGKLLFDAYEDTAGEELWVLDDAGSRRLADLTPQSSTGHSNPQYLTDWNGKVVFSAEDGVHGTELWISDGTAAGTKLLADINPGAASSSPQQLYVWNGALYFFASNGSNRLMRLSTPDGTPEALATLDPPPRFETSADPATLRCPLPRPVPMGSKLFFSAKTAATGAELWATDGTAAGTAMVADLNTNFSSGTPVGSLPCNLAVFRNRLYFSANATLSELNGTLWSTDGTTAGTVPLTTSGGTNGFVIFNDALYFRTSETQNWKSDGTVAGTTPFDVTGTPSGVVNGKLMLVKVFPNTSPTPPSYEIWAGDGTSAGTTRLSDSMGGFTISSNRIYYSRSVSGQRELWSSDGTASGTQRVRTLEAPTTGYIPFEFHGATHLMITNASSRTIWRTDGTEAGTTQVAATVPRLTTGVGTGPVVSGENVFYAGIDGLTGNELYAMPAEDSAPPSGGGGGGSSGGAGGGAGGSGAVGGSADGGGGGGGPLRWYDLVALAALLSWRFVRNSRRTAELGKNLSPAVNNL